MMDSSNTLVFRIIAPLFVAVCLYLIWYSRRRKNMMESFARAHHLYIKMELKQELQEILNNCFSLKGEGLVRSFDRLSSIADGGQIRIFRAVELLDLNPHARASSTHFPRIIALFDIPKSIDDEFFLLDKSIRASSRVPETEPPDPITVEKVTQIAISCGARHSLSVTFAHGHGLIYFEPTVTGGETISDIDALYCIARSMKEEL